MRMSLSRPADARSVPSGENLEQSTVEECPLNKSVGACN